MNRSAAAFLVRNREKLAKYGRKFAEYVLGSMTPDERREFVYDAITVTVSLVIGVSGLYLMHRFGFLS